MLSSANNYIHKVVARHASFAVSLLRLRQGIFRFIPTVAHLLGEQSAAGAYAGHHSSALQSSLTARDMENQHRCPRSSIRIFISVVLKVKRGRKHLLQYDADSTLVIPTTSNVELTFSAKT